MSDDTVIAELGQRLRRHRLDRNITQAALAREAGVSAPTVQRLEAGASVQLSSLLRILRSLGLLERLETLVPEPLARPMELLQREGRRRQRAAATRPSDDGSPWRWEEPG